MSNRKDFYRTFEDKYRGSRSLIKDRLRIYLPFIEPLKNLYSDDIASILAVDAENGLNSYRKTRSPHRE